MSQTNLNNMELYEKIMIIDASKEAIEKAIETIVALVDVMPGKIDRLRTLAEKLPVAKCGYIKDLEALKKAIVEDSQKAQTNKEITGT